MWFFRVEMVGSLIQLLKFEQLQRLFAVSFVRDVHQNVGLNIPSTSDLDLDAVTAILGDQAYKTLSDNTVRFIELTLRQSDFFRFDSLSTINDVMRCANKC